MSEKPRPAGAIDDEELVPEDDAVIGQALRWSLVGLLGLALIGSLVAYVLWPEEAAPEEVLVKRVERITDLVPDESVAPLVRFTDVTAEAGIDFVHFSGASGEKLLPETMGGGGAFFDYDGDGDQDLFFVNGAPLSPSSDGLTANGPGNHLYRNDGHGHFEDVTEGSGLAGGTYGMGAAVGCVGAVGGI